MWVKSYKEAARLARSAGEDAANRRMRKAGRKSWSAADHDHAVDVTEGFLVDLSFDIPGWLAVAGLRRNEPDAPQMSKQARKKPKARSGTVQVQLSFAFA